MKYLGLDMGTSRIRLISASGQVLVNEPCCLVPGATGTAAWGEQVSDWGQKQPSSVQNKIIHPFSMGSIKSYQPTVDLIKLALQRSHRILLRKPNVIATISAGSSNSERQAFIQALNASGFNHCILIPQSIASLLGAQIPLNQPRAVGVIHLGAGSSEVLVTCFGNLTALNNTTQASGDIIKKSLQTWFYRKYKVKLSSNAATSILHTTDALASNPRRQHKITNTSGKQLVISAEEIAPIIKDNFKPLITLITTTLGNLPIQALSDTMQDGLWLSGGLSNMRHIANYLKQETGIAINVMTSKEQSCIQGIRFIQRHFSEYSDSLLAGSIKKLLA